MTAVSVYTCMHRRGKGSSPTTPPTVMDYRSTPHSRNAHGFGLIQSPGRVQAQVRGPRASHCARLNPLTPCDAVQIMIPTAPEGAPESIYDGLEATPQLSTLKSVVDMYPDIVSLLGEFGGRGIPWLLRARHTTTCVCCVNPMH